MLLIVLIFDPKIPTTYMRKNIKTFAITTVLLLQGLSSWATLPDDNTVPQSDQAPSLMSGLPRPSRARGMCSNNVVDVTLSNFGRQLVLSNPMRDVATYYIYDDKGNEIMSGVVPFLEGDRASIRLGCLAGGVYTICIVVDNVVSEHIFQL